MVKRKTIFDLDLVKIGQRHAHVMWVFAAMVLSFVVLIAAITWRGRNPDAVEMMFNVVLWGLAIASAVVVVRLQAAMGTGVAGLVLYAIAALFLAPLTMIASMSQAGTVLRLAGARVGLLGVSESELAKLRPGHCRGCGYDRGGLELLQACPECSRTPRVV